MPSTITFSLGDVVLVNFVFTDDEGTKRRPALVLSSATYNQGRQEIVIAAITSNVQRLLPGDTALVAWSRAGLRRASIVTGILRTVRHDAVRRSLGALSPADRRAVQASLRLTLGL